MISESCPEIKPEQPCSIIIFGASGDLTSRKLIPALYQLHCNSYLPESFFILGCGRKNFTTEQFRSSIKTSLASDAAADLSQFESFSNILYYQAIEYTTESFIKLSSILCSLEKKHGSAGNRIFYMAVPPFVYKTAIHMIGQTGLSNENCNNAGWSRIVVEKPFGNNLITSSDLNHTIQEYFAEHQIYRIDHYLAKETVQNILVFRFANSVFEPVWNRQHIEYINICAAETLGVEHRAGYYEKAGIIRDMFQNHMMQLLALIAMELPADFKSEIVRDEKAKLFKSLRPFAPDSFEDSIVLGQYAEGAVNNKKVPSYRNEPGVDPQSLTPTFARIRVFIDNQRWQGVPLYLMSGKRLAEKKTCITVQFKQVPHLIFRNPASASNTANRLTFFIQPEEKISLTFQAKKPGASICLNPMNMKFSYGSTSNRILSAYEKVLIDSMLGEQMLFLRQDSEELCWSFFTPLIENCEKCIDKAGMLNFYKSGTWGPKAAEKMSTR